MTDDLTRRAIIAAHDAGCTSQCGEDATTFRKLRTAEKAIVELWRADVERAEKAEAANQRVRDLLYEWHALGRGDGLHGAQLRAALSGQEVDPDA